MDNGRLTTVMANESKGVRTPVVLVLVAFVVYLLFPGAPDSAFSGAPLPLSSLWLFATVLVALAFVWFFPPGRRLSVLWAVALIALSAAKLGARHSLTPDGWRGVYEMTDEPRLGPVRFINGFSSTASRVDRRLDFDGPEFNLPFYNDIVRYGGKWGGTRRDFSQPFQVRWTGDVWVDAAGPVTIDVRCRGSLFIQVDGSPVTTDPCPNGTLQTRPLLVGEHEIGVEYTKPREVEPLATVVPLISRVTSSALWPRAANRQARQADVAEALAALACGLVLVAVFLAYAPIGATLRLVVTREYGRLVTLAIFAGLIIVAVETAVPFRGVTTFLWPGDDPLAYESFGRDIALNGLLNTNGAALGHGAAFYFYPFCPYALALAHRVFGDDLGAAVFFNGVCIASMVLIGWALAWRRQPNWAAALAACVLGGFCLRYYHTYTLTALTDDLYLPLVFLAILASVDAVRGWSLSRWFLVGVLAAFAAATRPSFMTYPGVFAAFVLVGWPTRDLRSRLRAIGCLGAGFLAGLSPFTVRNWIVARKFVLLVSSWIQIPYFLISPNEPNHTHVVSGLSEALYQAGQIFAANPTQVLVIELRKLGFTMGFLTLGPIGQAGHPEFFVVTLLFVAALALRRVPRVLAFVLCAFAASHITAMVLAAPWTYGYKTILPLQVAFLLGATLLVARETRGPGVPPGNPRLPVAV
jgi:hypothetical protein